MSMAQPIEPDEYDGGVHPRVCRATRGDGEPCTRWAINGGVVCPAHGGSTPQVRRRAMENLLELDALKLVPDPADRDAITDPIGKLREVAEEISAMKDAIAVRVNKLEHLRYTGGLQYDESGELVGTGTEQLRAEVVVYERAIDRLASILISMAKLDLDKRWLEIEAWHKAQISGATLLVLTSVLSSLGLSIDDQQVRGLVVEQLKALPAVIEA